MSGAGKILASVLTASAGPCEVDAVLWALKQRGVNPQVVYVDDECCGAWQRLIGQIWPDAFVRLDVHHAIARLAQTTASTQHPWHGDFCKSLSDAILVYDETEARRLKRARQRDGLKPENAQAKKKYVPRVVRDGMEIAEKIDAIIEQFKGKLHESMGALLTQTTYTAWANLRKHVLNGCLSDPPDIAMNILTEDPIVIGGQHFHRVRSMRGSSSLEGFHSHQKQWLGERSTHAQEAGLALVAEGTMRWNRKRHNEANFESEGIPLVFANGLLKEIDEIHQRLKGNKCFKDYLLAESPLTCPPICHIDNISNEDKQ